MDKIRIIGGIPLRGSVYISGAKNAALPLMTAGLLTDDTLRLTNLPHLADIATMSRLLTQHGLHFTLDGCDKAGGHRGEVILLKGNQITSLEAPYDMVRKMRASVLVLGPLLSRFGYAKVSLPGGCAIGSRPINLHLEALEKLGAEITLEEGYIEAKVNGRLKGNTIHFPFVSVGATENLLMAASLAKGTTVLENAACEPEITDLAECLVKMGAHIGGIGTSRLEIEGVEALGGTSHTVVADRIETGTYMAAAAITGGELKLLNARSDIMQSTIDVFKSAGVACEEIENGIKTWRETERLRPVSVETAPYPDFPTDMQAQLMALMTVADGVSVIDERIFENRFMHVPELCRMGAQIALKEHSATITGCPSLKGAELMATDLRASVSLVIAALAAEGETIINRVYHIDRGYERIEEKFAGCGARIERVRG